MANVYNRGKIRISKDWTDGTLVLRILLLETATTGFAPDHNFVSEAVDGTNNVELATVNYTRQTLSGLAETEDDTNNLANYSATNPTWTALGDSTKNAVAGIIYVQVGADDTTPADDYLLTYVEFTDTTTNGSDFTLDLSNAAHLS